MCAPQSALNWATNRANYFATKTAILAYRLRHLRPTADRPTADRLRPTGYAK